MGEPRADAERILRMLRRNVLHLESLIEKVLKESAHVQKEMGVQLERRTFDLWPLVESVIQDIKPVAILREQRFSTDPGGSDHPCRCEPA